MPEHAASGWLLMAALLAAVVGMGWLALSMPVHAAQAWGRAPGHVVLQSLRWSGAIGVIAALVLCLRADHASMAVLVWVMALSGAALLTAFLLASRPRWLRLLAPWVRAPGPDAKAVPALRDTAATKDHGPRPSPRVSKSGRCPD